MDFGHDNMGTIVGEDRLSSLPDDVIHHILSFMDIKFAIQTSSLSSRWKLLWTLMPYLNFSTAYFPTLPKFSKFVDHVLSRRNNQAEVSLVNLYFHGKVNHVFVSRIINYAFTHNVQQFSVTCSDRKQIQFPLSLFSSQTLKHLSLNTYRNAHCITPTSPWDFPTLTTLHLINVTLRDDNTDKRLGLFSKCVNLKNLTLNCFTILGSDVFSICAPSLTNLKLGYECMMPGVLNVVAPKLENLHLSNCRGKYQILAPALSSLFCEGLCPSHISLDGCRSLENVNLFLYGIRLDMEDSSRIVGLLQEVHCAKFLTLNASLIEFLSSYPHLLLNQPSPFRNLKCLKIHRRGWQKHMFKKVTIFTELRNYLLDNSPSATIIMDIPEEPQPKKSRRELLLEARAGKKAKLEKIDDIMTESQMPAEQCRVQIEKRMESHKAEMQLQELERVKAQVENLRAQINHATTTVENYEAELHAHVGERLAEFESNLAELKVQIDNRKEDTGSQHHL